MKNIILAAILLCSIQPCAAQPNPTVWMNELKQAALNSWDCSMPFPEKPVKFKCLISHLRSMGKLELIESSGSPQFDAECAEALYSQNPAPNWQIDGPTPLGFWSFSVEFGKDCSPNPTYDGSEIRKFEKQQSSLNHKTVIVHKIPLSVLHLFPGLFTLEELLNESNLKSISIGDENECTYLREIESQYQNLGELNYKKKYGSKLDQEHILTRAEVIASVK